MTFDIDLNVEWCPNIVEWVTEPKFLAAKHHPFPRQMQWMLQLFEDYCPKCSDYEYIQDIPQDATFEGLLDRVQPLNFGVCQKCQGNRQTFKNEGLFHFPNEINVCAGQRSGKTAGAGVIASYHTHRFLKLWSPAKAFNLCTEKQTLYGTFTSTTKEHAKATIWKAFADLVEDSTWYQEYIALLQETGEKQGKELYRQGEDHIFFRNKHLFLNCSAATKNNLRGRLRFLSVVDEIAFMDNTPDADAVYDMLTKSLCTLRSSADTQRRQDNCDLPESLMINISSPFRASDKILRLLSDSVCDPRKVWDHVATWDANPYIKEEDLDHEKTANYTTWLRDYGAIPQGSERFLIKLFRDLYRNRRKR